jgi:glycosyltransferase involved in cell wall biosynthesis
MSQPIYSSPSAGETQRLKVLHIAPVPPPIGGMTVYIRELMRSKLNLRADMQLIRTDYLNKENYSGVARQIVNFANGIILTLNLLRSIWVFRPHIVHVQTNSGFGFFEKSFLAWMARIFGRKSLLHVHGGGFRDFYNRSPGLVRRLIRWCGEIPDRIVVASPQMRDTWLIIGLANEKITWINNGVQLPEKSIWDNPEGDQMTRDGVTKPITVLFLTRIALAKGIIELIEAVALLTDSIPELHLRIVGFESAESLKVKELILELGLEDRIHYIGTVSEEQKSKESLAADIYASPTHVEDLPYAVLEAISYGLPCVATAVGGIPSIIESGVNGILVPPKNIDELAGAIEQLIHDPDLRRRLGQAGRKTIKQKFTWDSPADEMYALYQEICAHEFGRHGFAG